MSLINSMLRDLDARKSDGPGARPLENNVRAVPVEEPDVWRKRVAMTGSAVLVIAAATAGIRWWHDAVPAAQISMPVLAQAAAPATVPTPAAVPMQAPVASPGEPKGEQVAPASAATPAAVEPQASAATNAVVEAPAKTPAVSPAITPAKTAAAGPATPVNARAAGLSLSTSSMALANAAPARSTKANEAGASRPVAAATSRPAPLASAREAVAGAESAAAEQPLPKKAMATQTPQQRTESEYARALELLEQGKTSAAIESLGHIVHSDSHNNAARQALIGALLDVGRKDDAMRYARDSLAEQVAQPGIALILARLQLEKGELRPALETLSRSLPYGADNAEYQAFLAALLQRDEQHKPAVDHYLAALQGSPGTGIWWMGLGISYQALQRLPEAQESFKKAKASNTLSADLGSFVDGRLAQMQR